jgi:hypothetical protein
MCDRKIALWKKNLETIEKEIAKDLEEMEKYYSLQLQIQGQIRGISELKRDLEKEKLDK